MGSGLTNSVHVHALQRKSHLCIPFLGIARPQSQFLHSCVSEQCIPRIGPLIFLQQNRHIDCGNIEIAHACGNWDFGQTLFLFWKYIFRIFSIVSLQRWRNGDTVYLKLKQAQSNFFAAIPSFYSTGKYANITRAGSIE
jgi:hypothetical protein